MNMPFIPSTPLMLASVTNALEAMLALEAGADIIDMKNPHQGALGALPIEVIANIVAVVNDRATTSATIGDLPMQPEMVVSAIQKTIVSAVDIVKIGFFGHEQHVACIEAIRQHIDPSKKLIAVLFADEQHHPEYLVSELLPAFASAGFYGVMLDTAKKDGRHLLNHWSLTHLAQFVHQAKTLQLQVGLAGALGLAEAIQLLPLAPTYLGFRSALCESGERKNSLSVNQTSYLKSMLFKYNTHA